VQPAENHGNGTAIRLRLTALAVTANRNRATVYTCEVICPIAIGVRVARHPSIAKKRVVVNTITTIAEDISDLTEARVRVSALAIDPMTRVSLERTSLD
jgi:hypothetical protein